MKALHDSVPIYIDLYMLHRDDPVIPVSTIIDYLNKEIGAGRIRAIAASNWQPQRIIDANAYASEHGLAGFVLLQQQY